MTTHQTRPRSHLPQGVYDPLQEMADLDVDVPKRVWKDAALETGVDNDADTAPADDASIQTGLDMF